MKKSVMISLLLIVLVMVGVFSNHQAGADNSIFHFNGEIDENVMGSLPIVIKKNTEEKFTEKYAEIKKKNKNSISMTLKFNDKGKMNELIGEANGSIKINNRNYAFKASGPFEKIINPDSGKIYYYGCINGNVNGAKLNKNEADIMGKGSDAENASLIIIFNPDNADEFFVSTGIGLDATTGVLIFGNTEFHKEYYDLIFKLNPQAEENWK